MGESFVFYTNYESRKGRELADNINAALLFPWITMERQVVVEGPVGAGVRQEAEVYFHSRPAGESACRLGFPPSTVVAGRPVIDEELSRDRTEVRGPRSTAATAMGRLPVVARDGRVRQVAAAGCTIDSRYRREDGGDWVVERRFLT